MSYYGSGSPEPKPRPGNVFCVSCEKEVREEDHDIDEGCLDCRGLERCADCGEVGGTLSHGICSWCLAQVRSDYAGPIPRVPLANVQAADRVLSELKGGF